MSVTPFLLLLPHFTSPLSLKALRDLCNTTEDTFKKRKFTLENYLRVLQTTTRNVFNLHDSMSLHNSLLYDLLIALKSRRKTCSQLGLQKDDRSSSSASPNGRKERDGQGTHPMYFYLSQVIQTPNGIGTVVAIDQHNQNLTICFPDSNSLPLQTKEFSCLSLSQYLHDNQIKQMDIYHLQNLQKKWSYHSLINEMSVIDSPVTPFQQNMKQIQTLTEDDLFSLIQPPLTPHAVQSLTETSAPLITSPPPTNNNTSSKKNKRGSNKSSSHQHIDETPLPVITPTPVLTLSSPLCVPLMETERSSMSQRQQHHPSLLFLKTGTLPYVVENLRSDTMSISPTNAVNLSLELSEQPSAPSTYTHHVLPNPYDDSFFESIGFDVAESSKYQTAHPSAEVELQKLHEYCSLLDLTPLSLLNFPPTTL
jgi:hypothetical protein